MMLRDHLARTFFGTEDPPAEIEIGLSYRNLEIKTPGYSRATVHRGDWNVRDSTATTMTRFGPFEAGTSFDAVILFIDNQRADVLPFGSDMALVLGMVFEHTVEVAIGG